MGPKEKIRELCTQDSVFAGDYALGITAFADSAFADTVESGAWSLRLRESSVEAWESMHRYDRGLAEAKRLPRSYEHLVLEIGFVGSLTGEFARAGGGGTLTVSSDGLEYVSKKRAFRLSAAQVRRVSLRKARSKNRYDIYVVVEYDDGGRTRKVIFDRARQATFDNMHFLEASVEALIEQRDKKR